MITLSEYLIVTGGHVVSAYVGEDITMNCSVDSHIPPEKLDEVSWKKVDQQIQVLIFLNGEVQPESTHERYADRVELFSREEIQKGNFSFRLKDLRTEDKGQYICEAFFGEFADNTTVEVQQLGFSSMHTGILLLCIIAFVVPVVLGYPAYVSLKRNDNSKRALAVQYTLVCCSNIALCLAFILWGVIEGFLTEAATCSAINLLRILFLFWIAPYLDTFKAILQRFIKRSAITLEYAVIAAFAYSGLFNRGSRVLIRMSVLLILEIVCASSSVYIHYDLLDTLDFRKERDGLTCLAAYLYVLTGMLLFKVVIDDYGLFSRRPHSNRTRQVVESSTVTGTQRTSGHAIVYMLGAVGLSCVNSVALAVELILKARNGERTVNDLRVILVPFECIFPIGCLVLQISAFCKYNLQTRHRL
uniref:Ig-like domain-containing protein n=1 Tax=Pygocentrus nattereri TaxID=42514 RepID=A0A3B4C3V6_PYGNA